MTKTAQVELGTVGAHRVAHVSEGVLQLEVVEQIVQGLHGERPAKRRKPGADTRPHFQLDMSTYFNPCWFSFRSPDWPKQAAYFGQSGDRIAYIGQSGDRVAYIGQSPVVRCRWGVAAGIIFVRIPPRIGLDSQK